MASVCAKRVIYTDTWVKPSSVVDVSSLKIGDNIKIKNSWNEKFWVTVFEKLPNNEFIGEVNNYLVRKSEYNYNDYIRFTSDDIWEHNMNFNDPKIIVFINKCAIFQQKYGRLPNTNDSAEMNIVNLIIS